MANSFSQMFPVESGCTAAGGVRVMPTVFKTVMYQTLKTGGPHSLRPTANDISRNNRSLVLYSLYTPRYLPKPYGPIKN
jgi:hypothetical protein